MNLSSRLTFSPCIICTSFSRFFSFAPRKSDQDIRFLCDARITRLKSRLLCIDSRSLMDCRFDIIKWVDPGSVHESSVVIVCAFPWIISPVVYTGIKKTSTLDYSIHMVRKVSDCILLQGKV